MEEKKLYKGWAIMLHGEINEYVMPLEEFYQKYGFYPPKHPDLLAAKNEVEPMPKKDAKYQRRGKNWNWAKLTLDRYLGLKNLGKLDSEIIDEFPWITYDGLKKLKKRWGLTA